MSVISKHATIGKNVEFGIGVHVHDNVEIGDNCIIGDYCIIGHPARGESKGKKLVIGSDSLIRSHVVIYEDSIFGPRLEVGHHCMIREGVRAGINCRIGTRCDLEGDCTIGDFCRFLNAVHIGRGSKIGNLVWIFPNVVLTNDPLPPSGLKEGVTVEDGGIICTGSIVLPGRTIGRGSFIAACTRVGKNIPPATAVLSQDGKKHVRLDSMKHAKSGKTYPWMSHFAWGYPEDAQELIKKLHKDILEDLEVVSVEI